MPLSDAATISNGYCGASANPRNNPAGDNGRANTESPEVAANPATISRRLSNLSRKSLRRLKFVAAKLLRAPWVRRSLLGHLAMNRKLFFGLVALPRAAVSQSEVVVSRRIGGFQPRCHLQRRYRFLPLLQHHKAES